MSRLRATGDEPPRRPINTTIAQATHDFFTAHGLYNPGRALDDWVEKMLDKESSDKADKFAAQLAAHTIGACKCGRITWVRDGKEECVACRLGAETCTCQDALSLRRRKLVEWQAAREEAGLSTSFQDIEAKKADLGLIPRDIRAEREQEARRAAGPTAYEAPRNP